MKLRPPSNLLQACLLALTLGLGAYQPAAWAGYHDISGTACAAYNNAQADALERSHVRIYNPPTNYRALFVICQMQRVLADVEPVPAKPAFYITAYFTNSVPSGTSVTCIFREFNNLTVHEPGDGLPDPWRINAQSITMTKSGTAAQTQVAGAAFVREDPPPPDATQYYWTFTCALPPGTGINEISVLQQ